jgi:hypothetical protein
MGLPSTRWDYLQRDGTTLTSSYVIFEGTRYLTIIWAVKSTINGWHLSVEISASYTNVLKLFLPSQTASITTLNIHRLPVNIHRLPLNIYTYLEGNKNITPRNSLPRLFLFTTANVLQSFPRM